MADQDERFEAAKRRFREHTTEQNNKRRRTIFINEEYPTTSRGQRGRRQWPHSTKPTRPTKPQPANVRRPRYNAKFGFFRTVPSPTGSDAEPTTRRTPNKQSPAPPSTAPAPAEVIELSDDDEMMDAEQWEGLCRREYGAMDRTVDRQAPRPPSPPSVHSWSSLDWEKPNFRPPTPPLRVGLGYVSGLERQFQHMGFRCYERTVTVRLMVPGPSPEAITLNTGTNQGEYIKQWLTTLPPVEADHSTPEQPQPSTSTVSRLNTSPELAARAKAITISSSSSSSTTTTVSNLPRGTNTGQSTVAGMPAQPPPPSTTITAEVPTVNTAERHSRYLAWEDTPPALREEIRTRVQQQQLGRFRRRLQGKQYRVFIAKSGRASIILMPQ